MSIEIIGKQIAALRKEKGAKQEELAGYVGVSAQAVSKWENGGVPDTELLPKIADFFSVPVDCLFGRSTADHSNLKTALMKEVAELPQEERFKAVFEYCWDFERSMFGKIPDDGSIADCEAQLADKEQWYSSILWDQGFTRMGIAKRLQYFLLVPQLKDTDLSLFEGVDCPSLFKDLSEQDVFDACIFLHRRNPNKAFTENLLIREMKLEKERAIHALNTLEKCNFVRQTQIELDDEERTIYYFNPSPSFVALLIFARELIKNPTSFHWFSSARTTPYL